MKKGILPNEINNCSAGAGTLILEFGTLSRLTGDMRFEVYIPYILFNILIYMYICFFSIEQLIK